MYDAPMWPGISLRRSTMLVDGVKPWRAETCTMRPPIRDGRGQTFAVVFHTKAKAFEDLAEIAKLHMWDEYTKAHPNNCADTAFDDLYVVRDATLEP